MVQIKMFAICLTSVFILNFVHCLENKLNSVLASVEVNIVQNITQFLAANPKFQLIQNLKKAKDPDVTYQITYTFGKRVNGDRLLGRVSAGNEWSKPHDVRLVLTYPQSGTGAVVSYVEIKVERSSKFGRADVISDGIGQRTIKIAVEAKNTFLFRHISAFYGY